MAKGPEDVKPAFRNLESIPQSTEEITEIADDLEKAVDRALDKSSGHKELSNGTILLYLQNTGGSPNITPAVIEEFRKRYLKSESNPKGWGQVELETQNLVIIVKLHPKTVQELEDERMEDMVQWMEQRPC